MDGVVESKEHLCYPVISENPSITQIMKNTRTKELGYAALWTVGLGIFGFAKGSPKRMPSAVVGGIVGAFGGLLYSQYNSMLRLKGYKENRLELIKAGIISPEGNKRLVKVVKRRPLVSPQQAL
ncbi:hypothetical protein C9374_002964 [Naegleria lovaniensis]|uniref:NADH-ubiquinone oxidoreductase 21kDa subunit N-terminal domain-containing protein n=1 Tax=Naegleria lovaniensis TaxID=51637 RepID=A0AA88GS23_NAELO|nr:uncharacterized protein C9374_002964 [Naegleria lovaniensis]KAG2385815.1 hypothetical protein C9374_002964 [Naegleria lovaniensis]